MISKQILQKLNQISDFADIDCRCTPDQKSGADPSVCCYCKSSRLFNDVCVNIENAHREIFPIGHENA